MYVVYVCQLSGDLRTVWVNVSMHMFCLSGADGCCSWYKPMPSNAKDNLNAKLP
jgi:hypothetical protein